MWMARWLTLEFRWNDSERHSQSTAGDSLTKCFFESSNHVEFSMAILEIMMSVSLVFLPVSLIRLVNDRLPSFNMA